MKFILGEKIEMSQIFDKEGNVIPVTLIEAGPCFVTQIKNNDKDQYEAVQLGFQKLEKKNQIKKTMRGKEYRYLREFQDGGDYKVGARIDVSIFQEGDKVKIAGISKGKGFQGVVKRHGFHGQSASHGVKHAHRQAGSIGATWPQRVIKGRRMAGRMGGERTTVRNLKIVKVDSKNNILAVKGAVPGVRGSLVEIRG